MTTPLDLEKAEFNKLRDRIAADFGLSTDDEAVVDTASGASTLTDLLERLVRAARDRQAQARVCKLQIESISERKRAHEAAEEKLRDLIAAAMLECGVKKLAPGDFTASVRMTDPKPEITNENDLPDFYTKSKRVPDKTAINGEYDRCVAENDKFHITGVAISNGKPSLTIRG